MPICQNTSLTEATQGSNFFWIVLMRNFHQVTSISQVQAQMKLAQRSYCNFVTWSNDMIVIRTSLDELFMEEPIAKANFF